MVAGHDPDAHIVFTELSMPRFVRHWVLILLSLLESLGQTSQSGNGTEF